jgi:uncharacterized damage-inducible protein DinB
MESQITESKILADVFQSVRNLTNFYISQFKDLNVFERLEFKGRKFNSAYWIIGHLVWSEHSLIIEGLGGQPMKIPWLEKFQIGSKPENLYTSPSYEEILQTLEKVHSNAINLIQSLSDEELDQPNLIEATFGGKNTKRAVVIHAIRHEPMHTGQLSWILKTHDIELV